MTREKFEEIVNNSIKAIPKRFLEKLSNVTICIEDEPTSEQLKKLRAKDGSLIFGLYEGIPQIERRRYAQILPDKITIFQKPIERFTRSEEGIKEIVQNTVWHELAHHFGLDETRVRIAEKKKHR